MPSFFQLTRTFGTLQGADRETGKLDIQAHRSFSAEFLELFCEVD
jgi:hypothetical protein